MAATTATAQEQTNGTPQTDGNLDGTAEQKQNSYTLHDAKTLQEAGELKIKDESGKEMPFKSLYEGQPGRQLVIFIRHFYCGVCEEYCRALAASLPPKTLAATTPPTKLTIIGCGEPECIPDYRKRTLAALKDGETFPIYCDRSRKLYEKFGMAYNLQGADQRPQYVTSSLLGLTLTSAKNILTSGAKGFRGGDYRQNGGEYLFEDGWLKWCHRMKTTSDHAEISELKQVLGL